MTTLSVLPSVAEKEMESLAGTRTKSILRNPVEKSRCDGCQKATGTESPKTTLITALQPDLEHGTKKPRKLSLNSLLFEGSESSHEEMDLDMRFAGAETNPDEDLYGYEEMPMPSIKRPQRRASIGTVPQKEESMFEHFSRVNSQRQQRRASLDCLPEHFQPKNPSTRRFSMSSTASSNFDSVDEMINRDDGSLVDMIRGRPRRVSLGGGPPVEVPVFSESPNKTSKAPFFEDAIDRWGDIFDDGPDYGYGEPEQPRVKVQARTTQRRRASVGSVPTREFNGVDCETQTAFEKSQSNTRTKHRQQRRNSLGAVPSSSSRRGRQKQERRVSLGMPLVPEMEDESGDTTNCAPCRFTDVASKNDTPMKMAHRSYD